MERSVKQIAEMVQGRVIGDDKVVIKGVNSLDFAKSGEISFFAGRRYRESLKKTNASAVLVPEANDICRASQVVVSNPEAAYAGVATYFAPPVPRFPGISEQAFIHKSSSIGKNVSVYPGVYIGEAAVVGDETILFPGVFIGDRVEIGKRTILYPNVTVLQDCTIGNDVIIHGGTVIGSDGFGFARDGSKSIKIPQIGSVQIDDHVEIGANNCIDRAALGKTWIQEGVKTDNLVHVGHNVVVGENTILVAQVGVSGSVRIGREVIIGGQVGIVDHLEIGDRAMVGPQSGIGKSVPAGQIVTGSPAIPHRLWLKTRGLLKQLPEFFERLRHLEKRLKELQGGSK